MSTDIERGVATLKSIWMKSLAEEASDFSRMYSARDEVLSRFQKVFSLGNLDKLKDKEFRDFLSSKNNKHWSGLQRLGSMCDDMERLKNALRILLDESRPVQDRLNDLVPGKSAYVPKLSRAVLTPILLICHPTKYGAWNRISENAMKSLKIWPDFERGLSFGERYERINGVMSVVANAIEVDFWILDALWWGVEKPKGNVFVDDEVEDEDEHSADAPLPEGRFGLERHLHQFLRDNWQQISLGQEWEIYEEDGEPEAGYEYPCGIGRIDILAKHRTEKRWLVIELKRDQSSDQTVGQVSRYIGWVKKNLAEPGEKVEGLVISRQADDRIRYAIAAIPDVRLNLYEVEFRLKPDTWD